MATDNAALEIKKEDLFSKMTIVGGHNIKLIIDIDSLAGTVGQRFLAFDNWSMKITNDGQDGVNVVDYVVNDSASPSIFIAEWRKNRPLCKTEADWDVFKAELPEIYSLYSIEDILGESASLQEVMLL